MIGYFGNLQKLTTLILSNNRISKIIPLNHYYRLIKLNLSNSPYSGGNKIEKIENLDVLSNLEELRLENNRVCRI